MSHGNLTQAPHGPNELGQKKKNNCYDFKIIYLKNIYIIKNNIRWIFACKINKLLIMYIKNQKLFDWLNNFFFLIGQKNKNYCL